MPEKMPYQPKPLEVSKAESMMSEEQAEMSKKLEQKEIDRVKEQMKNIIDISGLDVVKDRFEKSKLDSDFVIEILSKTDLDKFILIQRLYAKDTTEKGDMVRSIDYFGNPDKPIQIFLDDPLRAYQYKTWQESISRGRIDVIETEEFVKEDLPLVECPQYPDILQEGDKMFDELAKRMKDKWKIHHTVIGHRRHGSRTIRIVFEKIK